MKIVTQFAIEQWEGEHQTHYEMIPASLEDLVLAKEIFGCDFDVYKNTDKADTINIDLNITQQDYEAFEARNK